MVSPSEEAAILVAGFKTPAQIYGKYTDTVPNFKFPYFILNGSFAKKGVAKPRSPALTTAHAQEAEFTVGLGYFRYTEVAQILIGE